MDLTIFDGVVIAIVVLSALLAMFRGFVREVLSIAAWVVAGIAAYLFYDDVQPFVQQYIDNDMISLAISVASLFFVTLIVVSFITMKISDYVVDSQIGFIDRLLGFAFGAARGVLLVVVALLLFSWLVPNLPNFMTRAGLYPVMIDLGDRLMAALPEDPDAAIEDATRRLEERLGGPGGAPAGEAGEDPASYGNQAREGLDQLIQSSEGTPAAPAPAQPAADGSTPANGQ